jgi:5'-3' exonuclease
LRKHVGQNDDPENYRAVFGFCFLNNLTNIGRILHRKHPKFVILALCWDLPTSINTRRKVYPDYKATRARQRSDYDYNVRPLIMKLTENLRNSLSAVHPKFGFCHASLEADDVIAIIAQPEMRPVVVSSDTEYCSF